MVTRGINPSATTKLKIHTFPGDPKSFVIQAEFIGKVIGDIVRNIEIK